MTSERKKAALFLSITLIVGILIGLLVPSFYWRMRRDDSKQGRDQRNSERKIGFEKMIYRIVEADPSQKEKIQPILDATSRKIEGLEKASTERMIVIMDSMKLAIKPILKEEQMKKLEEFSQKARARRRGF
ncbi:MAG TPA: hypothetical protein PLR06_05085 [Cyclobacteriaceae bacterium]|nr:hypothetical protein [Cyclobacteriaceae bacterium]